MANDRAFISNTLELLQTLNNAIRRGMIGGSLAEQFNVNIINIGGSIDAPLKLHRRPVRFAVLPTFNLRTGEPTMAIQGIRGDQGTKCPVEFDNIAGSSVPEPTGTPVITVSSANVATAVLDPDGSSVDLFPLQPPVVNTPFTVTYTLGAIVFTQDFQVNEDLTATQGHFVTTGDTNIPLPAPAAP